MLGAPYIQFTRTQHAWVGGGWGLRTGGLIGLNFGPSRAGAGGVLAGAVLGGSHGAMTEIARDDPGPDKFAMALVKRGSKLIHESAKEIRATSLPQWGRLVAR